MSSDKVKFRIAESHGVPLSISATKSTASQYRLSDEIGNETLSLIDLRMRRKHGSFLKPDANEAEKGEALMSRLYDQAEDSLVFKVIRSRTSKKDGSGEATAHMIPKPPTEPVKHRGAFRTTFFKKDHERKMMKIRERLLKKNQAVEIEGSEDQGKDVNVGDGNVEDDIMSVNSFTASASESSAELISTSSTTEEDVVWEPVTAKSQMGHRSPSRIDSCRKPDLKKLKAQENLYDDIEPDDDDVVNHILRLRSNLHWRTMLPRHGAGVRRAMKLTNHKNPLKEPIFPKLDEGEFVYAIERKQFLDGIGNRTNPFDLQVVSAETARRQCIFYIVTASSVTKCKKNTRNGALENEISSVIWWLYEQRLFNMICNLNVFAQFRMWKQFTLWKMQIRSKKTSHCGVVLHRQLFNADETLLRCSTAIRNMCEDACGSRDGFGIGTSSIIFVAYDNRCTYELDEFYNKQNERCMESMEQLDCLRQKIVDMCYSACSTVAEKAGITKAVRLGKVSRRRYTTKLTVEEDTGPTFAQLSSWRQTLARLGQFVRHLDNLLLETLHRLVLTAVHCLLAFVSSSVNYFTYGNKLDADGNGVRDFLHERSILYTKITHNGTTRGHDSIDNLRRIVTGIEDRKVEEAVIVFHKSDMGESLADTESSSFKYSPRQTESIVTSDSELSETKTIEQIEREKELEQIPCPVFKIKLVLHVGGHSSGRRYSSASSKTSQRRSSIRHVSRILNEQEKDDDWKEKRPTSSQRRQGKRVSFPNIMGSITDSDDDDIHSEVVKDDSEIDSRSQTSSISKRRSLSGGEKAHVVLSPSKSEFQGVIQDILDTFESVISGISACSRDPALSEFTRPPAYDIKLNIDEEETAMEEETRRPWPDLSLLLGGDEMYISHVDELMDIITRMVDAVEEYSSGYESYCTMVEQCRVVDVNKSLAEYEWGPDQFSAVLSGHTEMIKEMKSMEFSRRIGLLRVEVKPFSDACLPFPQTVVDVVHERLPTIAVRRNEELLRIIRAACRKLDAEPSSVEQFVEHLTFLARLETEMVSLEKEFTVVNRLFSIVREFAVFMDPEDLALFQTLVPTFQHLKSTVLFCQARKDENILKFSTDLDQHVHNLRYQLFEIKNKVASPNLLNADLLSVVALETIKLLTEEVENLSTKARSYANYQDRFGSSYSKKNRNMFTVEALLADSSMNTVSAQQVQAELSEVERDLTLRKLLWESQDDWSRLFEEWMSTPFQELNVDSMQKNVNRFTQSIFMLDKGLPSNEIVPNIKQSVFDFKQGVPVIMALRNPYLKQRHWDQIQYTVGRSIIRSANFTLGNFLELRIFQHRDVITEISTQASNEATLENMLLKLVDLWHQTDFKLTTHTSGTQTVMVITSPEDMITLLEESQVTIGTIKGSRYVTPIKSNVDDWDRRLGLFSHTLDEWMQCQRNWLYLEAIFTTADIQRQLPSEAKLFSEVDRSWKELMRKVEDHPNALRSATAPGVFETLQSCNTHLEKIHKSLEDYLEVKRLSFPRFYFLSNDELLDVLSQGRNPVAIQPHLGKCFANIKLLDIKQGGGDSTAGHQPPTVRAMISSEGEIMPMPKNIRCRGPVEQWLGNVETAMYDTVKKHLKSGVLTWSSDIAALAEWVLQYPGQVVLTVTQIMYNKDVAKALSSNDSNAKLCDIHLGFLDSLNVLSGVVSEQQIPPYQYQTLEALIIICVHARDIVKQMVDADVNRVDDFEWKRQLRYEWHDATGSCHVLQADAKFHYGYEYLGCAPRLVITPLTDRCFLTLTGALSLHLGGSPAGPAGTGKSESVKDLAKVMGKQCVVFNCSEGVEYKMMGQFFSGLAQSGSWCCFDEFNRIDVEVLSVIASQVHTIKSAKDAESLRFMFEGREIRLNPSCGFFITMNPGYRGRVELPDNLKSLFRPVAMMVPDYALIAEIILYSEGFHDAKSLSRKIVNLYHLASKQLSQQDHYDFGMRAIKSVLIMAGQKKRVFAYNQAIERIEESSPTNDRGTSSEEDKENIEEQESFILIHALRDANLPKFLAEDVPLFESIMSDLFPGVEPPNMDNKLLEQAVEHVICDIGAEKWPSQIQKVIQLHSQLLVRHGVMLVGPSGGGKTMVRNILQKALALMPSLASDSHVDDERNIRRRRHIEGYHINPKCMELGELYGQTDPNTLEWSDGLLAHFVRKIAKEMSSQGKDSADDNLLRPTTSVSFYENAPSPSEASRASSATHSSVITDPDKPPSRLEDISDPAKFPDWRWLILDGPVDTLWVENLNTVLDDTKTLCLANGERIPMSEGIRLLFEVDDLSQASPATISRCAMVYLDPVYLGWRPYVKSWLIRLPKSFPEYGKRHLMALFELSIDDGLQLVRRRRKLQHLPIPTMSLICTLCRLLQDLLFFMEGNGGFGSPDEEEVKVEMGRRPSRSKKSRSAQLPNLPAGKQQAPGKWYMEKYPDNLTILLGRLFVFAFTWSIGGSLNREDDQEDDTLISSTVIGRDEMLINMSYDFDHFVHETFEVLPPLGVTFPSGSRSVFSYFVDMQTGRFSPWEDLVPQTKTLIERGLTYSIVNENMGLYSDHRKSAATDTSSTLVPTTDTIRYSFLCALLLLNKQPVLLTGDSGVGKTALLQNLLNRLNKPNGINTQPGTVLGDIFHSADRASAILQNITNLGLISSKQTSVTRAVPEVTIEIPGVSGAQVSSRSKSGNLVISTIQFSAQTVPSRCQAQILHRLVKRGRDTVGPPRGKHAIAFINDLNMPSPEKYGAQPPLELLRQFLELGGFYDLKRLSWKNVQDVTIAASAAPPGGGRNVISARLLKHFSVLAIPQPSTRSLQHIFQVQLGRFLESRDFMPEVKECRGQLVSAAIAVYYKMCNGMLPTPDKSHYTFNLRDLSAVIKGVLQANESIIVSRETVAHLFAHEATRVFHDRLTDQQDRKTFYEFLSDDLHNYFKITIPAEQLEAKPLIFGDFLDMNAPVARRIYRHIPDRKMLMTLLTEYYMRISAGNVKVAPLVFFDEAVGHVVRAARIFRQPGGHALFVGIDGTGKVTTCQLSCQIASCELYRLSVVRGYTYNDFREELKKVFHLTGVQNTPTVFLLIDSDIVDETILEDINCILNTGEDPDLFDGEELETILLEIKQAAVDADVPDNQTAVYRFFLSRVQKNLHVALALSPAGSSFRQRCRTHPALVNCCTIDWYDRWPREALISVAQAYFTGENMDLDKWETGFEDGGSRGVRSKTSSRASSASIATSSLIDRIASVCVKVHSSATNSGKRFWEEIRRHYYTTPSSYLEFIQVFTKMLSENKQEFNKSVQRLNTGLNRLSEAKSMVGIMQKELVGLGPRIEQKAHDTEKLMAQLRKDTDAVNQVKEIVKNEEEVMARETKIVQEYADQATKDLQSVLPALQEAVAALDSLDKSDVAEIRVYQKPPELVATVMNAVCILLQEKPDWATAKRLLADPGFLRRLVTLDRDGLPDRTFAKLRKITKNPDFTQEKVGQVSTACMSICIWVMALQHYNDVQRMVEPKQRRVKEAREALQIAEKNLTEKQASLAKIQNHLDRLKQHYDDNVQERENLKERKVVTAQRLLRASVLINALADEEVRWQKSVKELEQRLKGLIGDTIVSAASIAYLGAFTSSYRRHLVSKWLRACTKVEIITSKEYNMIDAMAEKNKIRLWHSEGLPRDNHSIENAIIIKQAHRWPLMIDPQAQAIQWIKRMEGDRLRVVYARDNNYIKIIENAIRVGEPVLLHDVEESIDPGLKPVLQCQLTHRAGQDYIMLGDTEISYNHNFILYMTTGKPNPHFLPAVCIMVTVINFTVTFEGLQDQLLSNVVMKERPHLETQRDNLLESIARDLGMLREFEDRVLSLLQKQKGHILDDGDLIATLKQSKITSVEIVERLKLAEENERRISAARSRYLPVATRGAVLQFVLADLESLNAMYQFSLTWFIGMFQQCIGNTLSSRSMSQSSIGTVQSQQSSKEQSKHGDQERLDVSAEEMDDDELLLIMQRMIDVLTEGVYRVVSYSLFNEHQLAFSFLLCTAIMRNNAMHNDYWRNLGQLEETQWQAFLHTPALANMISEEVMEKYDGLTPMQRLEMKAGITSPAPIRTSVSSQGSGSRRSSQDEEEPEDNSQLDIDEELPAMVKVALVNVARGAPPAGWISASAWQQCKYLCWKVEIFQMLCLSVVNRPDQWREFEKSSNVFALMSTPFVGKYSGKRSDSASDHSTSSAEDNRFVFPWSDITLFQRLMLIKILRPDMLVSSMRQFVIESVNDKFAAGDKFDLAEVFAESNSRAPIIFILSPGTDPSGQLLRFAKEMRGSTLHVDMVSLGRGQGPKAEELIHKAQILKGRWVFLQNCHLAASFMPRLQAIVDEINQPNSDVDDQFRLWLSSKPDPSFPIPILQKGLKMTVEPPRGLKANLLSSFNPSGTGEVTRELFDESERNLQRPGVSLSSEDLGCKNVAWKKLVFALCFFNAVIHERKKYDALGFNLPYEFTSSDLEVSLLMLQQLLIDSDNIPWPALRYLTGEVVYGGRVTDYWDRRCLDSTLQKFYCSRLEEKDYTYSTDGVYRPPDGNLSFAQVQEYIEDLPLTDSPDVFGMHNNADRAHLELEARRIVEVVIDVQPRLATDKLIGSGRTNDQIVMDLVKDIQRQLPNTVEINDAVLDDLDTLGGGKQEEDMQMTLGRILSGHIWSTLVAKIGADLHESDTAYHPLINSALLTVLRQEIDRFDRLLHVIHINLRSLTRAIRGEIVMSESLERTHSFLLMQKVPDSWQETAYESCKMLGSWVTDLTDRIEFFARWAELVVYAVETKIGISLTSGPSQQPRQKPTQTPAEKIPEKGLHSPSSEQDVPVEPKSFWLSAFFFPQGFLTAVLQNYARKHRISVDSLNFQFTVQSVRADNDIIDMKKKLRIRDLAFGDTSSTKLEDGVKIFGLYLDGARWNPGNQLLEDSLPGIRHFRMPEIHFLPVPIVQSIMPSGKEKAVRPKSSEKQKDVLQYECPLYRTSMRAGSLSSTGHSTNFVSAVFLPSHLQSDHWVLRGAALLCQLDD